MIPAGQRDQRITIQQPSTSVDALGQRVETWSDVVTVWARVRPLRTREVFAAGAMQSEASVVFGINYRDGITSAMRVVWRSVKHAIVEEPIDVDAGKHTIELICSAGTRDAQ